MVALHLIKSHSTTPVAISVTKGELTRMAKTNQANAVILTASLGFLSVTLYFLLYHFEQPILDLSEKGGWYFIVPLSMAFVFSIVHGAFTGRFWDLLGVKAKMVKK